LPSPVEGLGACPQKKTQFCAKIYAILNDFRSAAPIVEITMQLHVTSASEKVGGGLSPVLKVVGNYPPVPPASTPMSRSLTVHVSLETIHT